MSASKISMNKHEYLTKKKEKKVSGTVVNCPNGPTFSEILRLLVNLREMKMNVFDVRL